MFLWALIAFDILHSLRVSSPNSKICGEGQQAVFSSGRLWQLGLLRVSGALLCFVFGSFSQASDMVLCSVRFGRRRRWSGSFDELKTATSAL